MRNNRWFAKAAWGFLVSTAVQAEGTQQSETVDPVSDLGVSSATLNRLKDPKVREAIRKLPFWSDFDEKALPMVKYAKDAVDELGAECAEKSLKKMHADGFSAIKPTLAGDTTLVTTDLLDGYMPWSLNYGSPWPKVLGIKLSATAPATSGKLSDYGDIQLLTRDGALATGYFSLGPSPVWFESGCGDGDAVKKLMTRVYGPAGEHLRSYHPEKTHLARYPLRPIGIPYFTHGLGLKAVRNGLQDSEEESDDPNDIDAAGVFFAGFGFDGPALTINDNKPGEIDFQAGASITRVSNSTLATLYDDPTIDDEWVYGAFARLKIDIWDRLSLIVDYAAPLGNSRDYIDSVTAFSLSYSLQPAGEKAATAQSNEVEEAAPNNPGQDNGESKDGGKP